MRPSRHLAFAAAICLGIIEPANAIALPGDCHPSASPPPVGPRKLPAAMPDMGRTRPGENRTCRPGYVWRVAGAGDLICVGPESRALAAAENAAAASRRDPNGAYGPMSCISGFVWREAFDGDLACVPPERRAAVAQENRLAPNRTVSEPVGATGGGSSGIVY